MPREGNRVEKTTILVVDDDPNIRELICLYLKREGFHPMQAADGKEALEGMEQT
ncbi:response regulator, partial [Clostridium perfringens]